MDKGMWIVLGVGVVVVAGVYLYTRNANAAPPPDTRADTLTGAADSGASERTAIYGLLQGLSHDATTLYSSISDRTAHDSGSSYPPKTTDAELGPTVNTTTTSTTPTKGSTTSK